MTALLRVADSASPPTNAVIATAGDKGGIDAWIGYLRSPYAADSWNPRELGRVLAHAGRLLPVYVGPYNAATLAKMDPHRDATQTWADLAELTEPHHGLTAVCLDIEPGAWEASPADVRQYFREYRAALHSHGGHGLDVIPYANPSTLLGLTANDDKDIAHVWCASWRAPSGRKPRPLWPTVIAPPGLGDEWHGRCAWQQAGNVRAFGTRVDLSLFPSDFPLIVHGTLPAPAPKPHPAPVPQPPTATVTVKVDGHTYRGALPRSR